MSTIITPAPAYQKPSSKLYLGSDQLNLLKNIWTIVKLNVIPAGFTDGIEDTVNHRITPGLAGFYNVVGQVSFINIVAAHEYIAGIMINDTTWCVVNYHWACGGTRFSLPLAAPIKLSASDFVNLWANSQSGDNTVDVYSGQHRTFLSVQRVR